ncbi:MAG: 6-pyruvoyl trahydropterin synthase family protein [Methylococcales bacterium]
MYQLAITRDFIAQHYLIGGDWGRENQKHSHHYQVQVRIEADELDQHGYLIDIVKLESELSKIIDTFRDKTLNDLPAFQDLNPSLERFARVLWESLTESLPVAPGRLFVRLWENDTDWAAYHRFDERS